VWFCDMVEIGPSFFCWTRVLMSGKCVLRLDKFVLMLGTYVLVLDKCVLMLVTCSCVGNIVILL